MMSVVVAADTLPAVSVAVTDSVFLAFVVSETDTLKFPPLPVTFAAVAAPPVIVIVVPAAAVPVTMIVD